MQSCLKNLVEAHCYGISRTGQIVEQSRSSEKQKVFVSYNVHANGLHKLIHVLIHA